MTGPSTLPPALTLHLPAPVLRGDEPLKPFYARLTDALHLRGVPVDRVPHDRATTLATVAGRPGLHLADHGSHRHPRLRNAGIAYVYPFWNVDPWGIRALSSIAARRFDPAALDRAAVAAFTGRLRRRLVGNRMSRYPQPEKPRRVAQGCIAVFLQSEGHRQVEETCHLTLRQMIGALLARPDPRPIIVKPHPRDDDPQTRAWLAAESLRDGRLRVVDANIHDILSRAAVTVTINSAVGIESHLHRVPVVLCGQTDFHHAAVTVRREAEMEAGLSRAMAGGWDHDGFLYWYFALMCVNASAADMADAVLSRFAPEADPAAPAPGFGGD